MTNTTTNKTPRITKAMRYEDIKAVINGKPVVHGSTVEDMTAMIERELELLANKNKAKSDAQKAASAQDEENRKLILEYLGTLLDEDEGKTCSEIAKAVPELNEFNNQKIASLCIPLKKAGRIRVTEKRGRNYYSLA